MDISRYSIDVKTAMEDLYIGPQADVLQKVDRLNREFVRKQDMKIGITPKFRWKPGTYDKVKDILASEWLQWDKRPSGMASIFSRERSYTKNRLKDALIEIENILFMFRSENRTFINDPEEIKSHFKLFKTTLLSELEKINSYFPDTSINITNEGDAFSSAVIETVIHIKDIKINVSVGNRTGDARELGLIDYGDVTLMFKFPLCKWFNIIYNSCNSDDSVLNSNDIRVDSNLLTHHGSYGRRWNQKSFECVAQINPKQIGAMHPYVSRNSYGTGNVCMGEMMKDIIKSYLTLDWNSMAYWIETWMTSYKCGVTGPLNNINMSFVGRPIILNTEGKDNSDSFYEVVGEPSSNQCWDRTFSTVRRETGEEIIKLDEGESVTSVVLNQCDEISCTLREKCEGYQRNTKGITIKNELQKFIDENCSYEILIPSEQEEDGDCYHYSDLIRESCFSNNAFSIEVPWTLLEDSFRQKDASKGLLALEYMLEKKLAIIHDDDDYNKIFINNLIACKDNNEIWDLIKSGMEPREPLSDEQEEMAAWAHALSQQ
tara:strand:- start:4664 stop:6298 length:1635 start_codon:yes stop_codon:yes gene_type:complete